MTIKSVAAQCIAPLQFFKSNHRIFKSFHPPLNTKQENKDKFIGGRPTSQKWDSTDGVVGLQQGIPLASKTTVPLTQTSCIFLPAAGNRNDSSLNNAGSNGNYWSSSLNSSNTNNAWNLNFNSGNCNMNNNNRYNGQSVRAVCQSQHLSFASVFRLTRELLLADLYEAYYDARRHKRNKPYQKRFEANLDENLNELCDELFSRTYKPRPSTCFIITDPKKREVFAADFRDRIVHHLYYNYMHEMFERTFIHDTYSCIKKRGTHYGIGRLESHIRKESQGFTVPCYVMKMDIRGYFMHIDRRRLLGICVATIDRMALHRVSKHRRERWFEVVDIDFVKYLTAEIVLLDPLVGCRVKGDLSDWDDLPHDKSLFHTPQGCGLPIGNLTSQLFSNVYLNVLDQFMKRELKCRHYGRYVDDFYVVGADRNWLLSIVPKVRRMLSQRLGLDFHDGKLEIVSVWHGVEFVGAYVKPFRRYASRSCVGRMRQKLKLLAQSVCEKWVNSLNSFCGVLSHGSNYRLRMRLFLDENPAFFRYGYFDAGIHKFLRF